VQEAAPFSCRLLSYKFYWQRMPCLRCRARGTTVPCGRGRGQLCDHCSELVRAQFNHPAAHVRAMSCHDEAGARHVSRYWTIADLRQWRADGINFERQGLASTTT
jgi:hypothetical protein